MKKYARLQDVFEVSGATTTDLRGRAVNTQNTATNCVAVAPFKYFRAPQRRGFAVFTAIVLIGLTGIAIAALAALFTTHVHRTQQGYSNAQIRQLLLAAIHVPPPSSGPAITIALPPELAAQDATLTMQTLHNDGPTMTVQAVAQIGQHKAAETLLYRQTSGQWILTETHLFQ